MISILLPVYNTEPAFLRAALVGLLEQTFDAFSVTIIDDHSPQSYASLVGDLNSNKISYVRNERNLGMVANWNKCLSFVRGEYFILVGQDDILENTFLENYDKAFRTFGDVVAVSSGSKYIGPNGDEIFPRFHVNHRSSIFRCATSYLLDPHEASRLCLRNGIALGELTAQMFRSSILSKLSGYDPRFRHAADLDFFLSACTLGNTLYLNERLVRRRIHPGNFTNHNYLSGAVTHEREAIFEKHVSDFPFSDEEIASFRAALLTRAAKDLITFPGHRSFRAASIAVTQMIRHCRLPPAAIWAALKEIVTGQNFDRR